MTDDGRVGFLSLSLALFTGYFCPLSSHKPQKYIAMKFADGTGNGNPAETGMSPHWQTPFDC